MQLLGNQLVMNCHSWLHALIKLSKLNYMTYGHCIHRFIVQDSLEDRNISFKVYIHLFSNSYHHQLKVTVNMLVSSFDHSSSLVSSWIILNRKPWRKSHHTCSNPYLIFLLLLYEAQAKKPLIILLLACSYYGQHASLAFWLASIWQALV